MGVVDTVRSWFGGGGGREGDLDAYLEDWREEEAATRASDPRLYDAMEDGAQFTAGAAERLEYANPDIGPSMRPAAEIGGNMDARGQPLKALVHVGEWQEVRSEDAYWDDLRAVVGQDAEGFHYSLEARAENDDMQMVYWNGPHATVEDAKSRAADALDAAQRSWEAFSLGQDEEVEHEFREERNRSSLESSAERDRGEGMER